MPLLERVKFCRDLLHEPRRVLHGPRRRPARPGRRRDRRARARTAARRRRRFDAIRARVREHARAPTRCCDDALRPALAEHGIRIVDSTRTRRAAREELRDRFQRQIFPVLTPLAVGLGRPFPYISNLSLSLAVLVRDPRDRAGDLRAREGAEGDAAALRRDRRRPTFVPLEDLIAAHLDKLFPGMEISTTTSSGSRATPTSRSPTRPTTCCARSRTSCGAAASARSCASRSAPA